MRKIDEIEVNGKKLSNILAEHRLWIANSLGKCADLSGADLSGADLRGADLSGADLRGADLRGANLRGANLDYSCWPLWCGSKGVKVDRKQFAQLVAHICVVDVDDEECKEAQQHLLKIAKTSHRAGDLGLLGETE